MKIDDASTKGERKLVAVESNRQITPLKGIVCGDVLSAICLLFRRERSSSADSMEHALARPSSPRATRERGGTRRRSSASSSDSESESSDTGSESEQERNPVRTRRAGPDTDQIKRNVPLTSGNIRYTGHKDIKLTLNKVCWILTLLSFIKSLVLAFLIHVFIYLFPKNLKKCAILSFWQFLRWHTGTTEFFIT